MEATRPQTPVAVRALSRKQKEILRAMLYHTVVGGICLFMLYPILWLFASSLKSPDEMWVNVASLIPKNPAFSNYVDGWKGFGGVIFATFFRNSLCYSGMATLASVLS